MKESNSSGKNIKYNSNRDRRVIDRQDLVVPIKANFSIEFEGEVLNISPNGIAIKFYPLNSDDIVPGKALRIHLDMGQKIASVQGNIRQVSQGKEHFVVGLTYNREDVALFKFDSKLNADDLLSEPEK